MPASIRSQSLWPAQTHPLDHRPKDYICPILRFVVANLARDITARSSIFEAPIVWTAGEALYAQDVLRLSRHLTGDWRVGHSYSSTECGTITAQVLTPSNLSSVGDTGTVAGRPVDGVEACIVDEAGAPVSTGDIGEIIVRSRFLAQGYWNNPDLTAKTFKIDPLDRATRSFRTGDLGRWRSDGTLEHMGRKGRRIRLAGTASGLSKSKASSCASRMSQTRW